MYFSCSSDGSCRVILVSLGDTENGHDRIAHKFFNKSLVSVYDLRDFAKNPAGDLFYFFRVQFF